MSYEETSFDLPGGYLIAYWGEEKDVRFLDLHPDSVFYLPGSSLYRAFSDFICKGYVSEILEYSPMPARTKHVDDRCDWWREELRNLGYDIDDQRPPYEKE